LKDDKYGRIAIPDSVFSQICTVLFLISTQQFNHKTKLDVKDIEEIMIKNDP